MFGKKKEIDHFLLELADGVEGYKGLAVNVKDNNDKLVIESKVIHKPTINLEYNKIVNVKCISDKEIIKKNKHTIGRSIAGGLLLGGLGAVVGAASGVGTKKKTEINYYIVINYKSHNDMKAISFKILPVSRKWDKLIDIIKEKANLKNNKTEINL